MARGARTRVPVSLPDFEHRLVAAAQHLHGLAAAFFAATTHPGHSAERLQHLLHLHELLQQTIHFLDRRAAALRDALAAAPVDDVLLAPLIRRHGTDDRLNTGQLLFTISRRL